MAQTCCVEGCVPTKGDVTYFRFPTSRTQRLKWLDAISAPVKLTLDTALCSQHFLPHQYELVRGKRRLKAKVVPSVFDKMTKPNSPQKDKPVSSDSEDSIPLQTVKSVTTDPDPEQSRTSPANPDHRLEDRQDKDNTALRNGLKEDDLVKRKQPENISITDSESNKDIEDIIAHYQIKQIRPLHRPTDTQTDAHTPDMSIEIEVPASMNGEMEIGVNGETGTNGENEVIDVDDEAEPVFIEVSVGKGGTVEEVEGAADQDCMMLLESVQCEVDPSCLMFPPDEHEQGDDAGDDSDVVDLGEKKEEPVSLLTSSDEDDVIIEEPKYDMIEVSDETDEDDVPLVRLVDKPAKRKPPRKKKKSLKKLSDSHALTKLLWGQLVEYYCLECRFSTTSKTEYNRHVEEHGTSVIQVCEICSYTTSSKHQYVRHKRKHREDRRFKCHLCNYKARHNMSLVYHLKSHNKSEMESEKSVYKCEMCDFETEYKVKLTKHVGVCKGKRFHCNRCSFEADRKCDLMRHKAGKHKASKRNDDDDDYEPPK